jgi:hypothetical protein
MATSEYSTNAIDAKGRFRTGITEYALVNTDPQELSVKMISLY